MGNSQMNPNFGGKIGSRLNDAINTAVDEVTASHSGQAVANVDLALVVALHKAWPSGIRLSREHMRQLSNRIAYSGN